jgi:hypothetical protein
MEIDTTNNKEYNFNLKLQLTSENIIIEITGIAKIAPRDPEMIDATKYKIIALILKKLDLFSFKSNESSTSSMDPNRTIRSPKIIG